MHPLVKIAANAAFAAGKLMVYKLDYLESLQRYAKGNKDFATNVDHLAEQEIINILRKCYPDHGILAEETGSQVAKNPDYLWIIDPLDGTLNYANQHPAFAISIALQVKGRIEHAVIYDPLQQELFTATRGEGAQLNDRKLRMRKQLVTDLSQAVIGTVFPRSYPETTAQYLKIFNNLIPKLTDFRCSGASALDLAYVAAGRLDGYFGMRSKIWDLAAGVLLVQEAGGMALDFNGGDGYLDSGNLIAANVKLAKQLLVAIHSA